MQDKQRSIKILVIEDDGTLNELLVENLIDLAFQAEGVHSWTEAEQWLHQSVPDLIISDARLPDANALDLLRNKAFPVSTIILTAYGSINHAVEAIKAGAAEYLVKPVNLEELELVIRRVQENNRLRTSYDFFRSRLDGLSCSRMVGISPAMQRIRDLIGSVAPSQMTILIQGESGVGKEVVAQEIHRCSDRQECNLVTVDCCTIQEQLVEGELFGYERGAFTGANATKKGLVEMADNGTLFLDEIGEINPGVQAKLLRVLETGQFRRIGSNQNRQIDTRIIAATNRDLASMVKEGRFRPDLYYRLSAMTMHVPPLRERREDILLLARHFIENDHMAKRARKFLTSAAEEALVDYDWPGNIREMRNVIERAIILSKTDAAILPSHFALHRLERDSVSTPTAAFSFSFDNAPTLADIEKRYVQHLLKRFNGHRAKTSRVLGIGERTLYRIIEKYDLD